MSNRSFIEKINEIYSLKVKDYRFFYNLDMEMEDNKVKDVLIKINLKLNERYDISEVSELRGVQ